MMVNAPIDTLAAATGGEERPAFAAPAAAFFAAGHQLPGRRSQSRAWDGRDPFFSWKSLVGGGQPLGDVCGVLSGPNGLLELLPEPPQLGRWDRAAACASAAAAATATAAATAGGGVASRGKIPSRSTLTVRLTDGLVFEEVRQVSHFFQKVLDAQGKRIRDGTRRGMYEKGELKQFWDGVEGSCLGRDLQEEGVLRTGRFPQNLHCVMCSAPVLCAVTGMDFGERQHQMSDRRRFRHRTLAHLFASPCL